MFPPERIVCLTEETVEMLYPMGPLNEPGQRLAFFRPFPLQKPAQLLGLLCFAKEC